jgi:hypothetical protein
MKDRHRHIEAPVWRDFRQDGVWSEKLGFYLLWMRYLAISPSYELARRYRAGEYDDITLADLPADFEDVLAVYDDLGDVQRTQFLPWWRDRAMPVFGYVGSKPRVRRIDTLSKNRKRKASGRLESFIEGDWAEQGQPNAMVVSIPIGLSKTQITRQLKKLLERYGDEQRVLDPPKSKYPLLGTRQRKDTLFRYLMVFWVRCAMPRQALWRVGVRSRVSDTYSSELDPSARIERGTQVYDRSMLSVLTSRAYNRSLSLAENAARGRFPSYEKPIHAVEPDLHEMWKLISSRRKWQKQIQREKMNAE